MIRKLILFALFGFTPVFVLADNEMAPFANMLDSAVCSSDNVRVGGLERPGPKIEYNVINRNSENPYLEVKLYAYENKKAETFKVGNGFEGRERQNKLEDCGFITASGKTYYLCNYEYGSPRKPTFRDVQRKLGGLGFVAVASPSLICHATDCYKVKGCKGTAAVQTLVEYGHCRIEKNVVRPPWGSFALGVSLNNYVIARWLPEHYNEVSAEKTLKELQDAGLCRQLPATCEVSGSHVTINGTIVHAFPGTEPFSEESFRVTQTKLKEFGICK